MDTPDPQNPSSSQADPAEGQDPSQDNQQGAGDPNATFQSRVSQAVQGKMDRSRELVQQGRYNELDPKVVELLTAWDTTTKSPATKPSTSPDWFGGGSSTPDPAAEDDAAFGRKAKAATIIAKATQEAEQNITSKLWAEDVRALFVELGDAEITQEQFVKVDPTDANRFPRDLNGYLRWKEEARQLRDQIYQAKFQTDKGDTALSRDKQVAARTVGTPTVQRSGKAVNDLKEAADQRKSGKLADDAFREMVHGVLNR